MPLLYIIPCILLYNFIKLTIFYIPLLISHFYDKKSVMNFLSVNKIYVYLSVHNGTPCHSTFTDAVKHPSKHNTLPRCWANAAPPSTTLAQHWPNTGATFRACWDTSTRLCSSWKLILLIPASFEYLCYGSIRPETDVCRCQILTYKEMVSTCSRLPTHWI